MRTLDHEDFEFLSANAGAVKTSKVSDLIHLDLPIAIWNYIRIANDIATQLHSGHILDWGCGLGQMTYLLRRRGFQVTAFDIGDPDAKLPDIPLCRDLNVVHTTDSIVLPFPNDSFDAVLSCGVFEHVEEGDHPGDESKSLLEIARVLRPDGFFLMYQLPQRYAWQETLLHRLKLGYSHPRRYSAGEIARLLSGTGYVVRKMRRVNFFPKNLTQMPGWIRAVYNRSCFFLLQADRFLCQVPGLNQVAGSLEICAQSHSKRSGNT